ncbi:MAG: hypothetical protein Q8N69_02265 [bacterium]|nr:hypothetical protein [bacterium]
MARIAIIGSGFVGQATGKGFAKRGHETVFCDINRKIIKKLGGEGFKSCLPFRLEEEGNFDFFFISVPTPTVKGNVNLNFLRKAVVSLGQSALKRSGRYCLVVPRSTIPMGTTENMIIPMLQEHSGKMAGRDFGVCFNPEFLREEFSQNDFDNPRIVMIGELDRKSGDALEELYASHFSCPIYRREIREAELYKLMHNSVNAAKISLGNEMGMLCESAGIEPMRLMPLLAVSAESCWNPLYGFRRMGHYGGSCLPKDTVGLVQWARSHLKMEMILLEAVIEVNKTMIKNNGGLESLPKKEMVY